MADGSAFYRLLFTRVRLDSESIFVAFLGLVFAAVMVVNVLLMNLPLGPDGGAFLVLAKGLLNGGLPYVEYIDHKPPGVYLFLAGILGVSESVWVLRVAYLLINVLTAGLIFILGREMNSKKSGGIAAVSYLSAIPLYEGFDVFAEPPMALLIIITIVIMLRFSSNRRRLLLIYAGFAAGGAILFKQTAGFIVIAICIMLLGKRRSETTSIVMDFAIFSLAVCIPVTGVALLYAVFGRFEELVYWTLIVNLTNYSSNSFGSSLGNLYSMVLRFPLFWLFSVVGVLVAFRKWRCEESPHQRRKWEYLLVAGVLSIFPLWIRQYGHYFIHSLPFASLFVGILGSELWKHRSRFEFRFAVVAIILIATLLAPTVSVGGHLLLTAVDRTDEGLLRQQQKAAVIDSEVPDGEKLLILGHEAEYYHLSGTSPVSPNPYYIQVNRNGGVNLENEAFGFGCPCQKTNASAVVLAGLT
jgi:hypothetical protein